MNELQIFQNSEFGEIRTIERTANRGLSEKMWLKF